MKYFKILFCVLLIACLFFSVVEAKKKRGDSMNYTYSNNIPISLLDSLAINNNQPYMFIQVYSSTGFYIEFDDMILRNDYGLEVFISSETSGASGSGIIEMNLIKTGVNGLDSGSLAANTFYYVWVAYNPNTAQLIGIASLSYKNPTLPTGFTFRKRVGTVVTDSSSNLITTVQVGNSITYFEEKEIKSGSFTTGAWTTVSVSQFFPFYTARKIKVLFGTDGTIGNSSIGISASSGGQGGAYARFYGAGSTEQFDWITNGRSNYATLEITFYSHILYYYTNNANSTLIAIGWEE